MLLLEDKLTKIANSLSKEVPGEFGRVNDCDYFDDDYFIDDILHNYDFAYETDFGATKYVIIPDDFNYVIKIPFNGEFFEEEEYDEEYDEYYSTGDLDFVPFREEDYCKIEEEIYNRSKLEHLDFLFAKTKEIAPGVYQQDKVYFYKYTSVTKMFSKKASEISTKANFHINNYWLASVIENYGELVAETLIKFLKENNINDLHGGNCGWDKNNKPVLADFSGYRE